MKFSRLGCLMLAGMMTAMSAGAGSWQTQATLANNGYQGSIALDASGNMIAVWYQNAVNGVTTQEIWASNAPFGAAWSTPVDISGGVGSASGPGYPSVHSSTAGFSTAVYTNATVGESFVDRPAGGPWGSSMAINGVGFIGANQFYVADANGDEGLAWGTGGARASSSTVTAVRRPAGGTWSAPATLAAAPHLAFDGALVAPDGSMAVAWESFNATCNSRTCTTSNWQLHVSTLAAGSQSWVDSGVLLGPDATQHFGQLAADTAGDLGLIALKAGNVVSVVRHGTTWSSMVTVVPDTGFQFYSGTGRDNRTFASDSAGHATLVGWGDIHLRTLTAIDGNLATNTWGSPTLISGTDQYPGYFDFAMNASGAAIVFYPLPLQTSNTPWRAITRPGAGQAWNAPATAGTSNDGGGTPDGVALDGAGQAAVVFHGYSADYTTQILYTNTYKP
jgi:hypothetical protein